MNSNNSSNTYTLELEGWIKQFVTDRELYVMRDKRTRQALNVSYSRDGLKWTINPRSSKLLYYKNAYLRHNKVGETYIPYFDGDLSPSKQVIIEKFVPEDHYWPNGEFNYRNQLAEIRWLDKGMRLLYSVEQLDNALGYSSTDNSKSPGEATSVKTDAGSTPAPSKA